MANVIIGPNSGDFVVEPALMKGHHLSPGTTCYWRTSYFHSEGEAIERINCYSGSSSSRSLSLPLSVFVLGKVIIYLYSGPLISGIYFAHPSLNLVHSVLSSMVEPEASPIR